MQYVRYHRASGAIDFAYSVIGPDLLPALQKDAFAYLEVEQQPSPGIYVDPLTGELMSPTLANVAGGEIEAFLGEAITITGLPEGAWVREGLADPVQIGASKALSTLTSAVPHSTVVRLVGSVEGPMWRLSWAPEVEVRSRALARVDADAEAARQSVITPGAGQAMTYLRKADAARIFLNGGTISGAQMQRITDEANRLGVTDLEAAQSIVRLADAWEALDAGIDDLRLTAKRNIEAATSGVEISSILAGINWPI